MTLADSFPASDPPSWTPGIARVAPDEGSSRSRTASSTPPVLSKLISSASTGASAVALSRPNGFLTVVRKRALSVLAVAGLALAVPFVILLVGLPIALLARVLLEAISLVLTVISRF